LNKQLHDSGNRSGVPESVFNSDWDFLVNCNIICRTSNIDDW